jgi:3-methyladenine DNA glycosylase AlkD
MTMTLTELRADFRGLGNPDDVENLSRFFKCGTGEYGEGDRFLGIRVPVTRKAVKRYRGVAQKTILSLLRSPYHEERLLAVLLLVDNYERGDAAIRQAIFETYLANREGLNNWDIIDSSAYKIVGPWLADKPRDVLYELAAAKSLWDRRIAMLSCYHFIKHKDFEDALRIAALLRDDSEDLIHKAVGWMLREIGNRDRSREEQFLKKYYAKMPRTMLRYAIEKFSKDERRAYLDGRI